MELVLVMIVAPTVLNAVQFWVSHDRSPLPSFFDCLFTLSPVSTVLCRLWAHRRLPPPPRNTHMFTQIQDSFLADLQLHGERLPFAKMDVRWWSDDAWDAGLGGWVERPGGLRGGHGSRRL